MTRVWARAGVRRAVAVVAALVIAPWLPLYVRRSMTRSFGERGGDLISWGFDLSTLPGFVEDMRYMRPEESKYLWLGINLGLFAVLVALVALALATVWRRLAR